MNVSSVTGFVAFYGPAWVPFALKDGVSGMSPGKWLLGLQVVDMETRQPAGLWQTIKRNLWVTLPCLLPLTILPATAGTIRGRHFSDRWAETLVVWRRYAHCSPFCGNRWLCQTCGYNLTGNTSGICPECGTPIGKQGEH